MQILVANQTSDTIECTLIGEFDALGCFDVRQSLDLLIEEHGSKKLTLDLEQVSFMDSSGIGAIVFLLKRLRAGGGALELVNVKGQPRELITLLRVDQAIPVSWESSAA